MSENITVVESDVVSYILPRYLIDLTGIDRHLDTADWVDYIILTIG